MQGLPLLDRLTAWTPGEHLIAQRRLDPRQDLFLGEHALGRQISALDGTLRGLPVVPFTFSMEILAEAAGLLCPGLQLAEMAEVRAYRWIVLEDGPVALEVEARRSGPGQVQAVLRTADDRQAPPFAEAQLTFAPQRPAAPQPSLAPLDGARPSAWQPQEIYRSGMFHGPAFRGVRRMDAIVDTGGDGQGKAGAQATVQVLSPSGLFRGNDRPGFVTDPVLLDQPGQVVGLWTAETLAQGYIIFPYRLGRLRLFDVAPQAGEQATCRARIELLGQERVRSDLELIGGDGRVWLGMEEWEDLRFDAPQAFLAFMHRPGQVQLSQPVPAELLPPGCVGRALSLADFPADFLSAHGGIWQKVLAYLVLGRQERTQWHGLRLPERRRLEWLLARLAAKEALCQLLDRRFGLGLAPADVEIVPDAAGRPTVQGAWLEQLPAGTDAPLVSIAHSGGQAVALAAPAADFLGVGVDVELPRRVTDPVAALAFTDAERQSLAALAGDWPARFWCGKEAVAKAVGVGLQGGPQAWAVARVDADREILWLSPPGAGAQPVAVQTGRLGELMLACAGVQAVPDEQ